MSERKARLTALLPCLLFGACSEPRDEPIVFAPPPPARSAVEQSPGTGLSKGSFEFGRMGGYVEDAPWLAPVWEVIGNQSGLETWTHPEVPDIKLVGLSGGSGILIMTWYVVRHDAQSGRWKLAGKGGPIGYFLDMTVWMVIDGDHSRIETRSFENSNLQKKVVERIDLIAKWKTNAPRS